MSKDYIHDLWQKQVLILKKTARLATENCEGKNKQYCQSQFKQEVKLSPG